MAIVGRKFYVESDYTMQTLTPEPQILTKSQQEVSPQFSPAAEALIERVCDVLNAEHRAGPVHETMKAMLDVVSQAVHSVDDRYIEFVTYLFNRAADEYLRKPEPSVSVERLLLDLTIESLAHCAHERMAIPDCVRGMLPCVQDALEYGDDEHVAWIHERLSIVVQGAVYGRPVWMEEACV